MEINISNNFYPKIPKVTELRIGNCVFDDEGETVNIEQVHSERLCYYVKVSKKGGKIYSSNIYMIPITYGFLEANEFKKDDNGHYWRDFVTHYLELIPGQDGFYPLWCELSEMGSEEEKKVATNRVRYINELQNLVFAITGHELKLKS